MKTLSFAFYCLAGTTVLWVYRGSAETVNGLVSEQIASHFEQVFSPNNSARNQDRDNWLPGNDAEPKLFDMDISLSGSATWVASSSIKNSEHDADVWYSETSYNFSYPFKPGRKIGFIAKISDYYIDETKGEGEPVFSYDHASQNDLGVMYTTNLNPQWDLFGGVGVTFTEGNGPLQGSNTNYMVFLGASYTINPDLTISFGGVGSTNPTFDSGLFPQFMLEWRINDLSRLSIRDGLYYQYALTSDWRNILGFSFECFCISVEEEKQWLNGKMRDKPTRIIEDYSMNLTYSHRFTDGLILDTKVGLGHLGHHGLWEGDHEFTKADLKYSVGLSLGLSYRF